MSSPLLRLGMVGPVFGAFLIAIYLKSGLVRAEVLRDLAGRILRKRKAG